MNISEETFAFWSEGPSQTEANKCAHAESGVRDAISADDALSLLDVSVFPQGSYRARTNVRQDSDVDICVRLNPVAFDDYPAGKTMADYGRVTADISFPEYKNLVEKALVDYFGQSSVRRGDKAFDVHANTYRIDADVVAGLEHRRYLEDGSNRWYTGIAFETDGGKLIRNWPEQNYDNGIAKNNRTSRNFKRLVRILKRMRYKMEDEGVGAAGNIPSFLIECLVWNVPDEGFLHETYTDDLRYVIAHTFNATIKDETCAEWGKLTN
jgi:hypothetical protein